VAPRRERDHAWVAYGRPVVMVAACTLLNFALFPYVPHSALPLVYLLGVIGVAARSRPGPSAVACALSVAAFDFFFVPPHFTFAVAEPQDVLTFGVMFVVALIISGLTVRIRWLADSAAERERRTAVLYALSRDLAAAREVPAILEAAVRHIGDIFGGRVLVLVPEPGGSLGAAGGGSAETQDLELGQWVYLHRRPAGLGTETSPEARALYLPLAASRGTLGVLAFRPSDIRAMQAPERVRQLETFSSQVALALERAQLAVEAQQAQLRVETESMRSSLLSSVSHDLRTPLATITGTATTLLQADTTLDAATRRGLLETLCDEAGRLNRLVRNLLDMTRLESGAVEVRKEWHPLEEIVGAAVARVEPLLHAHSLTVDIPDELPLVALDDILIQQALINLLENAAKHTPPGTAVHLTAEAGAAEVTVQVADTGPGIPAGEESRIFAKFYRGPAAPAGGAGLGLAICRGIVEAHGGRIWAENRPDKGAVLRFTLPLGATPPRMEADGE
jgi:two-component system sensor histidine kinase KdpD